MEDLKKQEARLLLTGAFGALLALTGSAAVAQAAAAPASSMASDPNPYYLGASEAITHDTNIYRVPGGKSGNYSSTSLLGGFDQPIGRQRIFANASVSANRYQDESQLNNTSYNIAGGLDWSTIGKLSGNVNVSLNQNLAAPAASATEPVARRNVAQTEGLDARIRYGGASLLTLEGSLGYSKVDYSAPEYASSESHQDSGSLGLYYRPSGLLRLGLAYRINRSETPKALLDLTTGAFTPNTTRGKNLDLTADYDLSGQLSFNGRLSYTRQRNSGISSADFSGLTGGASVGYRPTGKLSFSLNASRDAGFNTSPYYSGNYDVVQTPSGPVLTPVTGLYENNQVTDSLGLGVVYAATAKVSANAGLRYARAKLVSGASAGQAGPDTTDVVRGASIGANWAISRIWSLGCSVSHESRDVSGGVNYSYSANTVGCSAQVTWR